MADLNPLIRLRRHTVNEKQRFVADLYRQAEAMENKKSTLQKKLREERAALETMEVLETLAYFGRFADAVRADIRQLDQELSKLEARIQMAQEDMRSAFAELKRVEIVQRRREEAEKAKQNKRESQEMDELGLEGFRRKED